MVLDDDGYVLELETESSAKAQGCVVGSRIVAVRVTIDGTQTVYLISCVAVL